MSDTNYKPLKPFKFWCQTVLPTVYDDSLSYYELLNKVVEYLNVMGENIEGMHDDVVEYEAKFNELKSYVDNYFENLDVQAEINGKLDAMAENGELSALLAPFIPDIVADWLAENITPTTPVVDDSLSIEGAAADAATVGANFEKTLMRKALGSVTSAKDLSETGLYFVSIVDGAPVVDDVPYTVPCVIYNFVSNAGSKLQILYPFGGSNVPVYRTYNHVAEAWTSDRDMMSTFRNMIYDSSVVSDVKDIQLNTYRYVYASTISSGLPEGTENGDILYIECKAISRVNNVKEIELQNWTKNIIYRKRFLLNENTWTEFREWVTDTTSDDLNEIIYSWNVFEIIDLFIGLKNKPTSYTHRGVTWAWDSTKMVYTAVGSPTGGQSYFNIYSGDMPVWMKKGETYHAKMIRSSAYVQGQLFFQRNGSFIEPVYIGTSEVEFTVPSDVDNHILWRLATTPSATAIDIDEYINGAIGKIGGGEGSSITINNTINENTYTVNANPNVNPSTPYVLSASADPDTDRTSDIQAMLAAYGVCILGAGTFATTGLTVSANKCLLGSGVNTTTLKLLGSSDANCVQLGTNGSVSDLTIFGGATSKPTTDTLNRNGIAYISNFTPDSGARLYRAKISNVTIYGCANAGIYCNQSGAAAANALLCENVNVYRCYCGVRIGYYSEYHCFTNVIVDGCYYGIINNSGNNTFVNCSIGACDKGFAIILPQYGEYNDGHGSLVGCKINHTGNNTGDAIILDKCSSYVFSGCQFFYGNIKIKDSTGVVFNGCNAGSIGTIDIDSSTGIMFDAVMFNAAPTVNKSNDSVTVVSNACLRDGSAVII